MFRKKLIGIFYVIIIAIYYPRRHTTRTQEEKKKKQKFQNSLDKKTVNKAFDISQTYMYFY